VESPVTTCDPALVEAVNVIMNGVQVIALSYITALVVRHRNDGGA
jgi:hypothetical protein